MHFYHLKHVSLWVIFGEFDRKKNHIEPKISQNYNRKKLKSGKPRQALLGAHFIIQIAIGGSQFIPNAHRNDSFGPK